MASITHRENKDGSVTSMVRFRIDGKQVSQSFATAGGAETFAALVESIGGEAALRAREARNSSSKMTLREWYKEWLDPEKGHLVGITDGTRENYQRGGERSFLIRLGDYPVDEITRQDVAAWIEWQRKQPTRVSPDGPSNKTLRNFQAMLSGCLTAATRTRPRLIDENPAVGVRIGKTVRKGVTFLTPAEFEQLMQFVPLHYKSFILFMAGTGMRFGEATALTWGDIDTSHAIPLVRITKAWKRGFKNAHSLGVTKSAAGERVISITHELVEILGKRRAGNELVFPNRYNGQRLTNAAVHSSCWRHAISRANDPKRCAEKGYEPLGKTPRLHDLRHSHASWLIAAHASLPYIQQRLGHEKITTTIDVYGHLAPEAQAQMAELVAQSMDGVLPRLRVSEAITDGDELVAQITE